MDLLGDEWKHFPQGSWLEVAHQVRSKFKDFLNVTSSVRSQPGSKIYCMCVKCNVNVFEKGQP